jgi:hypothetical protein
MAVPSGKRFPMEFDIIIADPSTGKAKPGVAARSAAA